MLVGARFALGNRIERLADSLGENRVRGVDAGVNHGHGHAASLGNLMRRTQSELGEGILHWCRSGPRAALDSQVDVVRLRNGDAGVCCECGDHLWDLPPLRNVERNKTSIKERNGC